MEGQPGSEKPSSNRESARAEDPAPGESRPPEAGAGAGPRASSARMSWPPPRLPPRPSMIPGADQASTESSPPPLEVQPFDSQFPLPGSRTPSGEFRISQIRDLLFGDVQHRYDQRLTSVEGQLELLQKEARTRLGVMESSVVGEIGGALSALTERVVASEGRTQEETQRLDERANALEDIFEHRLDALEQEVRSLRSDLEALGDGVRLEVRDAIAQFEDQLRHEMEQLVMQRVHQEIGHVFLAIGGSMRKRAVAEQAAITGDLGRAPESAPDAPTALPTEVEVAASTSGREASVVELSAAGVQVTESHRPVEGGRGELAELERWAEELSSGDIPILDPDDEAAGRSS